MRRLRRAPDFAQHRRPAGDRLDPAAWRERKMGVIIKRPIANAAWRHAPEARKQLHSALLGTPSKTPVRFHRGGGQECRRGRSRVYASLPGGAYGDRRHRKPGRWRENAAMLEAQPLAHEQFQSHPRPLARGGRPELDRPDLRLKAHASSPLTTCPTTSVSRKSRPWKR